MDLPLDFKELLEAFGAAAVEHVLIGGYAVAFHGHPRATKDIDILVEGSPENLTRAAQALASFGAPPNVVAAIRTMTEDQIVYFGQPPMRVDVLRSIDGVSATQALEGAVEAHIDGLKLRVISLPDLIANKEATGRPRDADDATYLRRVLSKR